MSKRPQIYVFVEKNMGNGFGIACPPLSVFRYWLYKIITRRCAEGLSKHWGFLIYHHEEIDQNCTDPRAAGRSPRIEMTAIFPWNFDERNLFSSTGNSLLSACRQLALDISKGGKSEKLAIDVPMEWYKK